MANPARRLVLFLLLVYAVLPVAGATFTVTSPVGGFASGQLGEAITLANSNPGPDTIAFSIGSGPVVISVVSSLPEITDTTLFDGTTQPGYAGAPLVTIDANGSIGLQFHASAGASGMSRVEALAIRNASVSAIRSDAPVTVVNTVLGQVGTEMNAGAAITLTANADGSVVDRNVIGGNGAGVSLQPGAANVVITGNFIGVEADGTTPRPNRGYGITLIGATNTIIGGTTVAARNVISGNTDGSVVCCAGISTIGGSGLTIAGNYIGVNGSGTAAVLPPQSYGIIVSDEDVLIGGATADARNIISGNTIGGIALTDDADGVEILNNYIGLDAAGAAGIPNGGGISAGGRNHTIGRAGQGNVIAASARLNAFSSGSGITTSMRSGGLIEGNLVGLDAAGVNAIGNENIGIDPFLAANLLIRANVIAASGSHGVLLHGSASFVATGIVIENNRIGVNLAGAPRPNGGAGVAILFGAHDNTIGIGAAGSQGNVIHSNSGAGVEVIGTGTGNRIRGNSIDANGALGIELWSVGVTPNDPGDADTGPNGLQNFPVLEAAVVNGSATTVTGSLNSSANAAFTVDFYASPAADPSGFGEGRTFLGTSNVTTNGAGEATFSVTLPVVPAGNVVTATATGASGTSEFSAAATVVAQVVEFSSRTYAFAENGGSASITVQRSSGVGTSTVQFATSGGTATPNVDYTPVSGTLTFASGELTRSFVVPLLDDSVRDSGETIGLTLSSATGATLGAMATATLQVLDDEPPVADLTVTKNASAASISPNGLLTYTVVVRNTGPDAATSVVMTDTLPAGVTFITATVSQGTSAHASGVVTASLGSVAAGTSARVDITVRVVGNSGSTIINTASATANELDPTPASNVSVASVTIMSDIPTLSPFFLLALCIATGIVALRALRP